MPKVARCSFLGRGVGAKTAGLMDLTFHALEVFMGKEAEQFGYRLCRLRPYRKMATVAVGEQGGAADVFQSAIKVVA